MRTTLIILSAFEEVLKLLPSLPAFVERACHRNPPLNDLAAPALAPAGCHFTFTSFSGLPRRLLPVTRLSGYAVREAGCTGFLYHRVSLLSIPTSNHSFVYCAYFR